MNRVVGNMESAHLDTQRLGGTLDDHGRIKVFTTGEAPEAISGLQGRAPSEIPWSEWARGLDEAGVLLSYVEP